MTGIRTPRAVRPRWVVTAVLATGLAAAAAGYLAGSSAGRRAAPGAIVRQLGDSLSTLRSALTALRERVADIDPALLGAGLMVSLLNGVLVAGAWRRTLRAAYPDSDLGWGTTAAVHYAAVGANSVLPARAGDVLRLFLVHRRIEGATYPTLAASLLVEAAFGAVVGIGLLVWAWSAGYLPAAPAVPDLPLFELSAYAERPWILAAVAGALAVAVLVAARRVTQFWRRVGQGLRVLTLPRVYLTAVLPLQAGAFAARVVSAMLLLAAFGVEPSVRNALLVQVAGGLSSLVPATPGGLGPRQALLVVLLTGEAPRGDILAFGIGIEVALTAMHAVVGIACLWALLGRGGFRGAIARAREHRAGGHRPPATGGASPRPPATTVRRRPFRRPHE